MKVISGKLRGRTIKGFDISGTRPTMDRVKESVFAMIQNYIHNAIVLDLFSGSGNLGIEALSNGAKITYFNDYNKKCINVINENLINFNLVNESIITNLDYLEALKYYKNNNIKFDLIFLDPPYKEHIIDNILKYVYDNNLLNDNGLIICETDFSSVLVNNYKIFKERSYGDKRIIIYQK